MVLLIAGGVIPATHYMFITPWEESVRFLWGTTGMFGFYGLGFMFFHFKIPERWIPGKVDIWGHSHQFWHLCFVLELSLSLSLFCCVCLCDSGWNPGKAACVLGSVKTFEKSLFCVGDRCGRGSVFLVGMHG